MDLRPKTEAELAEMVAGLQAPVRLQGGGTRAIGQVAADDVLTLSGISGVVDYEPGALTLVAKAGTPLGEIEALLAAENQRLSFEPMDHRVLLGTQGEPTIGGVVAANVSGPRRISVGACRDFALGVRFVDGLGRVLKNGGRVMKNVTGYDLVKLMAGSWGTLGAMTEISLKVMPCPEVEATLALHVSAPEQAVAAMSAALGSPYEVTGAAQSGSVYLRIEGFAPSVAYRLEALEARLRRFGDIERIEAAASAKLWQDIRDVRSFAKHDFVTRVSLRPTEMPVFLAKAQADHSFETLLDWGGGLAWLASDKDALGGFAQAYCAAHGGHATRIKDAFEACAFQPEAAPVARLSQGVRQRFDPKGLFNPELMARG
ncbi:FAD-binding protein [Lentibacter sp.]|uniref:FAD-binding protein n=1 Tax=Lentibacter sp. TaxID=2024994 RepID=UPI003F6AB08E